MGQTMILIIISILFMIGHYKHHFLIWMYSFDALALQELPFFPPFSFKSKFIPRIRQTQILIIISILLVTGHYKYVLLIWIHDFYALLLQEKLFSPLFLVELTFVHQMGQTWILEIISILFMIGHYKHILLIWIYDLQEMLFFHYFFQS